MTKTQYDEMFATKKAIDAIENAMAAGYTVDRNEYTKLLNTFEDFKAGLAADAIYMTPAEYEAFRLRYVFGYTYHTLTMVAYRGLKSETTARKLISRWFKRMGA